MMFQQQWAYHDLGDERDLRIDFIRGLIMVSLVMVHIEIFSIFTFAVWERIGVISSAEGFVLISGLVIGMVYRKKVEVQGLSAVAWGVFDRSLLLYRVNLFVIISIALLGLLPFIDAHSVMTFTNRGTGEVFNLYPSMETPYHVMLAKVALLQAGPHQFQILGLYSCLLAVTPLVLWLLSKKRIGIVLGLSWILYLVNWAFPSRLTGAQFEYAFPIMSWQLLFYHGMVIGYFRREIEERVTGKLRFSVLGISSVLFVMFMFFSLNNPNPALPSWAKLSFIEPQNFYSAYNAYFQKNSLGLLRIVNYFVVLTVVYAVLTKCWEPIFRGLGWFFIPIGQASLYVFTVHIFIILAINNIPIFQETVLSYESANVFLNSMGHVGSILLIWIMVKQRFLFHVIPR